MRQPAAICTTKICDFRRQPSRSLSTLVLFRDYKNRKSKKTLCIVLSPLKYHGKNNWNIFEWIWVQTFSKDAINWMSLCKHVFIHIIMILRISCRWVKKNCIIRVVKIYLWFRKHNFLSRCGSSNYAVNFAKTPFQIDQIGHKNRTCWVPTLVSVAYICI